MSARQFAEHAGVSSWTLYKWRRELGGGTTGFVELVAGESVASARPIRGELDPTLEIALPSGVVVRVGRDVDEALLRRIVLALV